MKIGLDYDGTFTADPNLWLGFIDDLQFRDHEVVIVTFRDPGIPIELHVPVKVYYTSYKAKRQYMKEQGIEIDVWIDDSPETIVNDSQWSDQERERWREDHKKKLEAA